MFIDIWEYFTLYIYHLNYIHIHTYTYIKKKFKWHNINACKSYTQQKNFNF